jgi:hypothetical protein
MEVPDEVIRELRECLAWLAEHTQQSPQAFDYSGFLRGLPEPPPALLPCPFCGSEGDAEVVSNLATPPTWMVFCRESECHARGPLSAHSFHAIQLWNTRKES